MREKIAEIFVGDFTGEEKELVWDSCLEDADSVLTLMTEEIEKVANPAYKESLLDDKSHESSRLFTIGFEDCRQKILSRLRSKE